MPAPNTSLRRRASRKDQPARYSVPATLSADQWALAGTWTVSSEGAVLQQPRGKIVYRFNGRDLHLVLGPAKDGQADSLQSAS